MNKREQEIVKRNFATVLKGRRTLLGWTQDELAYHAKVDKNTIGRLETKESVPEIVTIIKIANGLNVHPGQFFGEFANRVKAELDESENE